MISRNAHLTPAQWREIARLHAARETARQAFYAYRSACADWREQERNYRTASTALSDYEERVGYYHDPN